MSFIDEVGKLTDYFHVGEGSADVYWGATTKKALPDSYWENLSVATRPFLTFRIFSEKKKRIWLITDEIKNAHSKMIQTHCEKR